MLQMLAHLWVASGLVECLKLIIFSPNWFQA